MLTEVASYLLYVYGLMYASLVPCPYPDHQPVDTSDHQQVRLLVEAQQGRRQVNRRCALALPQLFP